MMSAPCCCAEVTRACARVRPCAIPSSRSRSMRLSTPDDSMACDSFDGTALRARGDSMLCACVMTVSTFRDRSADDECKHEGEHGKPLHDRRRRYRDPEDRRLAFGGVDGGST